MWYDHTEPSQNILKYFLASFSSSLLKCVGRENRFTLFKMVSLKGAALSIKCSSPGPESHEKFLSET